MSFKLLLLYGMIANIDLLTITKNKYLIQYYFGSPIKHKNPLIDVKGPTLKANVKIYLMSSFKAL